MPRYDPYAHAEQLGIEVCHRSLPPKTDGLWFPDYSLILLRPHMCEDVDSCTLAHEIGHAVLGHCSTTPKHELLADRVAAQMMISPSDLDSAARGTESAADVARELGVTEHLLGIAIRFRNDPIQLPTNVLAA